MRKAQLKEKIQELNAQNKSEIWLLIIQVGDNEASNRYIRNKMKDCEEVGIIAHHYKCPIETTTEELVDFIIKYQGQYAGVRPSTAGRSDGGASWQCPQQSGQYGSY